MRKLITEINKKTVEKTVLRFVELGITYVIDTKWKRPANHAASIEELRQMYSYARFWNSNKVLLLYPGQPHDSGYQPYPNPLDLLNERTDHHRCKTVYIQVLEHQQLDKNLAPKILQHLVN